MEAILHNSKCLPLRLAVVQLFYSLSVSPENASLFADYLFPLFFVKSGKFERKQWKYENKILQYRCKYHEREKEIGGILVFCSTWQGLWIDNVLRHVPQPHTMRHFLRIYSNCYRGATHTTCIHFFWKVRAKNSWSTAALS